MGCALGGSQDHGVTQEIWVWTDFPDSQDSPVSRDNREKLGFLDSQDYRVLKVNL